MNYDSIKEEEAQGKNEKDRQEGEERG